MGAVQGYQQVNQECSSTEEKILFRQFTEEASNELPNRTAQKLRKLLRLKHRNTEALKQGQEISPSAITAFLANSQDQACFVESRKFIPDNKFKDALSTLLYSSRTKKAAGLMELLVSCSARTSPCLEH